MIKKKKQPKITKEETLLYIHGIFSPNETLPSFRKKQDAWRGRGTHKAFRYGLKAQLSTGWHLHRASNPSVLSSCPVLLSWTQHLRKKGERETKPVLSMPLWHAGHEHIEGSTGGAGVPGTAEARLGTEGFVHNKALDPPQNLDLPISHTGTGC